MGEHSQVGIEGIDFILKGKSGDIGRFHLNYAEMVNVPTQSEQGRETRNFWPTQNTELIMI
jgi:hypothetical protein